ncbi:long-chain acyl-CoA synthetase [Frondihabitans australicus]|uniref:Long-chain acyl-CoA synthetase n=2 Tax=Frondihabitans australicus TaxID=386892 RepID=A0A495IE91_9MICO|nr:long-chain acyl-CoA synthetase [Frondihabitans australicus]
MTTGALLDERVSTDADARLVAIPDSLGSWFDLTAAEFSQRVRTLARGLVARGIRHGDRIGVLSANRLETTLLDFAAGFVGAVTVPLDRRAGQSQLLRVLDDATPTAVVVETPADFARFDELHSELPTVLSVWQLGLGDLDKIVDSGRDVPDDEFAAHLDAVTPDDAAGLLYSFDDEGAPVRSTLTHGVLATRARQVADALGEAVGPGRSVLQILPATDPDARLVTLAALATGTRLGHLHDRADLVETLHSFRPTLLVGHPATFAFIDEAARVRAEAGGRATAFRQAHDVALEYAAALSHGAVPMGLRTRFTLADTLVLRGLRRSVGGQVSHAVSIAGTTTLPERLRLLMRALDVRPVEGFGTAATGGLATIERVDDPFERQPGTVGAPLPGIEVDIDDDGLAAFRGPGIAAGAGASEDAWLSTGLPASIVDGRLVLEHRDFDEVGPGTASVRVPDHTGADASADF